MHSLRERVARSRWRRRLAARRTVDHAYRVCVGIVGGLIVAFGLVTIPLPGPGWLTVIAGLFVLATEFLLAERLLEFTKRHVKRWTDWVKGRPVWVRVLLAAGDGGVRLRRPGGDPAVHLRARLDPGLGAAVAAAGLIAWRSAPRRAAGVGSAPALGVWHNRTRSGDWLSGRALRSHRRGHWFEPSIAHRHARAR